MKKSLRLALLACAGLAGLALAGPALASYSPSLTIEQSSYKLGAPFTADLFIAAAETDDPSAKLSVFSPAGYGVNLSKAPGTKVGSAIAIAKVAALGGAPVPLAGDVVVGNPADPKIQAASAKCRNGGATTNQAVLVLNLALSGQAAIPFPVFVNKAGPLTVFEICVPHPDDSTTNPNGARILLLDATIKGVFKNASTSNGYEWSALFTPYDANKAPNPAGTVEWRTYVGLPSKLTLARVKTKKGVKLTGRLSIPGINVGPPQPVRLSLYAGKKATPAPNAVSLGTGKRIARGPKLPKTGKYTIARPSVKFATFFQTRFENYGLACNTPSPTGQTFKCIGEDIAPISSNQVKVLKPKKKRH